jgi:hypothetical protein
MRAEITRSLSGCALNWAGMASHFGTARNIAGAQQWHDEIGGALERCDWLLLVLSPNSVNSKWVKHELLFALNDARYEQRIIPCILKKCDINKLSWTLSSCQFVDFSKDFERGMRALLKVWSIGYKPPLTPTAGKPRAKTRRRRKSGRKK